MKRLGLIAVFALLSAAWAQNSEEDARAFMDELYKKSAEFAQQITAEKWALATAESNGDKPELQKKLDDSQNALSAFYRDSHDRFKQFDQNAIQDPQLKRMFLLWSNFDDTLLSDAQRADLTKVQEEITNTISGAEVKEYNGENMQKSTDFASKVNGDRDPKENEHYWTEWFNAAGRPVKPYFKQWLDLEKALADTNGFQSVTKYWESLYEVNGYEATMVPLMEAITPLYQQFHAWVRHKLREDYNNDDNLISPKGTIPTSLLGSKWGVDLSPLMPRLLPFPTAPKLDVSKGLESKGLKGRPLVEAIDAYFQKLGFEPLPPEYYSNSVFEKKGDMDCITNTYNFYQGNDIRAKMCADPNQGSWNSAIDSVEISELFVLTKDLPHWFKRAPNAPFGNAFFGVAEKLVNAPDYLKSVGLLDEAIPLDVEVKVNALFQEAAIWLFMMPFALSFDMWRWHVMDGPSNPDSSNCDYWALRTQYQGVEPPVDRSASEDFDPGVHAWAISGNQYMLYFISKFLEYDILRALCAEAGYWDPNGKPDNALVFCDISNSPEAGKKLKDAIALGDSQPWYDVLNFITGHNALDASALNDYFKPLEEWLTEQNRNNQVEPGWPEVHNRCK